MQVTVQNFSFIEIATILQMISSLGESTDVQADARAVICIFFFMFFYYFFFFSNLNATLTLAIVVRHDRVQYRESKIWYTDSVGRFIRPSNIFVSFATKISFAKTLVPSKTKTYRRSLHY